ncbi:ArnT family glycosyltransferase [Robiginitalea sp. IMCC43444]|uniref:ArnT family glycosyltransferase n=1 Tax=Robiginitalea sp. IMCC43444 TaxID=3459121 RepID=UPI0040432FAF
MISARFFWAFLFALIGVYLAGMFATLMENDSAQFAVMAMRMVQEQDFFSLWKGTEEYLDKPHMHYWLAAISYSLFGIEDWAYRIPAILATLLGAYSCYGLGGLLYSRNAGKIAALIFLSSQTIVLSLIDVRTDAVLTGFTVLAIWKLMEYLRYGRLRPLLIGAAATGIAFSTKGQIAIVVIGLPLICQLGYTRNWKRLFNPKIIWALVVFGIVITPMLYAYYQQFDLHPEKMIRGRDNRSGILFILWEQSFERLSGEGVGKNSSDYFFFFHTFLWVFLPWTLLGLAAYWDRAKTFLKKAQSRTGSTEVLTLGGITTIFLIISFAQFKLPHYLNITIPLFAVLTAGFLDTMAASGRSSWLLKASYFQLGIFGIVLLAVSLIVFWVFPLSVFLAVTLVGGVTVFCVWFIRSHKAPLPRLLGISLLASLVLNSVLNLHFYPELLKYQAGSEMAKLIEKRNLQINTIYKLNEDHSWALDFYFGKPLKTISTGDIASEEVLWVYATEQELENLREMGLGWQEQYTVNQFRISRLQARFLNPGTREKLLRKRHLLRMTKP